MCSLDDVGCPYITMDRYYVDDPSGGVAPGVVKDSDDREIAGKLELLKVGGCRGRLGGPGRAPNRGRLSA